MDIPLGLSMALAQNEQAMAKFAAMSPAERAGIVEKARLVDSKNEMRQLVDRLRSNLG